MKTLQNNFTTPEQSKRLLELGVPADSADCIFYKFSSSDKTWGRQQVLIADEKFSNICIPDQEYLLYLPCWSVGRLIEIDLNCRNKDYCLGRGLAVKNYDIPLWENGNYSICDYCVDEFIARIELGDYDFSKLED